MQLEKDDGTPRAQDRDLWREIGALQCARTFHASQIAALDAELDALVLRGTEKIEGVDLRMGTRMDGVVDTIRFNIRTVIAVSAVLIALAELALLWLR